MPYLLRDTYGQEFPVRGVIQIGRDPACQILLSDLQASRVHATLWEDGGRLILRDENSRNGTFINGQRVRHATLQPGDHIRIGDTTLVAAAYPDAAPSADYRQMPARASRGLTRGQVTVLIAAAVLLLCIVLAGGLMLTYPYLANNLPFLPHVAGAPVPTPEGSRVLIMATSQPQQILTLSQYQKANQQLAQAIEALNLAELQFIQDSRTTTFSQPKIIPASFVQHATYFSLDSDLCEVAAQAMDTGQTAESLMLAAATQGEGSQMENITAGQYASIARSAYALVIDTQDLRQGLGEEKVTKAQAASKIAEYGAQLWNPVVKKGETRGNPFLAYVENLDNVIPVQFLDDNAIAALMAKSGKGRERLNWLATSADEVTRTVTLPRLGTDANLTDANLLQTLSTAAGQTDTDLARQAAAFKLKALVPPGNNNTPDSSPDRLTVSVFKGISVAGQKTIADLDYPTYPKGNATSEEIMSTQELMEFPIALAGQDPPVIGAGKQVRQPEEAIHFKIDSVEKIDEGKIPENDIDQRVTLRMHVSWALSGYKKNKFFADCEGSGIDLKPDKGSGNIEVDTFVTILGGDTFIHCTIFETHTYIPMAFASAMVHITPSGKPEILPTFTPTSTSTMTPTLTTTPTLTLTPTEISKEKENAQETEIAAQKTAEFLATVTEIARQTESERSKGVFNFNGFFGMTEEGQGCMPGAHSSGTIQITVDFGHNTASGTFSGGGDGSNPGVVCNGLTFDMTCSSTYSGSLGIGTIDPASGRLSFSGGSVNGAMNCQFTNCKQNGVEIGCANPSGTSPYSGVPAVTGLIDKNSLSGNGKISVCTNCQGDWSAGQ